ncbi:hypothetical protein Acid345_0932 [Candidatus Koribacter versatilis Ellin345]|uniref:Glycosyl hydrolase-like 10 domain-containing protein n=1 Tax=Koribacter versatilis (strain Ellin345) TaxID=204669 RepID=Q1IT65_KORVE|nr:hypothetical protein [Candidatus Koribacter versatilis]ABF39935.1 hypothetical protein Acid345_0932 [Candidatus Koribacter versatilis Ellin345]
MRNIWRSAVVVVCAAVTLSAGERKEFPAGQDWSNYVRIGGYGLKGGDADEIVENATRTGVFGIEVDNDIPGRYESYLHPEEKLAAIKAVAEKAHKAGNYAFVYIAGTECITANADKSAHTLAKDHPDWLQRKITGEPAVFGAGSAFWIAKGDEDVWVSPYATEWRKTYMQRVAQIAGTGIDGIYVDIPYWMTHFDGWEQTWASFDDYTVAEFKKQTGLDAKKDLKLGDFTDKNFQKWIEFRIQTFTDFMNEIATTAKKVNPKIKTIPEIYPGIEQEAVRVGADVYSLYPVVDAIAHEYEFGEGDHMASSRSQLDWFNYQVGMHTFRAFAEGKPTWILNYSWDGDKKVDKREAMMNLAMSQVMANANFWDAPGHSMGGSNDETTRTKIFKWIAAHEDVFYMPRSAMKPVGVYFSPETRNLYSEEFLQSYRGILILLMQSHREFQVVTPRTLGAFQGQALVLPDVRVLTDSERAEIKRFATQGGKVIATGTQPTFTDSNVVQFENCPGKEYYAVLAKDFAGTKTESEAKFLAALPSDGIAVEASSQVATSIARVDGSPHVYFANFSGLIPHENPVQTPQTGVRVTVPETSAKGFFLPFMGEEQEVVGTAENGRVTFVLPAITKGAVFWYKVRQ